jgi:hypothetical protein
VARAPSQAGSFGEHVPVLQLALGTSQYLPTPHSSISVEDSPSGAHFRTEFTEQ